MPNAFTTAYDRLNDAQLDAVDTLEGPLLVLAGPGTGKTQLLSTRAANIVKTGDVNPSNILCLTYTETGASEMRQRMASIMGASGGDVAVYTFHGFGSWLINQYPEYFSHERALLALDDLGRYRIISGLLAKLPLRHALAIRGDGEVFLRLHAVQEAIGAYKQAGLAPDQVQKVLVANQKEYSAMQPVLDELFSTTLSAKRLPAIRRFFDSHAAGVAENSLQAILLQSLQVAIETAEAEGKTAAIGRWRDAHTSIKNGTRVLKSASSHQLLLDVVKLYAQYQDALDKAGRYDYADMINWATQALQANSDLLLDVAERFQFIMVDEYQDTNGAQNQLLDVLLQANPLNSPNAMVVGDDDQAIMRFQGAEASGMLQFVNQYEPTVISLQENYRSSQLILDAARQIITQSPERLEVSLENISKELVAQEERPDTLIEHYSYPSPSAEYTAIAELVLEMIADNTEANQIAIIGRKHAELANFVPFLTSRGIAINYDRREDVLEHPAITELLQLAAYVNKLATAPSKAATGLANVLAADYWQLPPLELYKLATSARFESKSWLETMLDSDEPRWRDIAEWLIAAAKSTKNSNFTQILDVLMGRQPLTDTTLQISPFQRYFDTGTPETYATVLSHLIALRSAVLTDRPTASSLNDLLEVCQEYRQSGIRLVDDNPLLRGSSKSVQVMTAHGSKGREFEQVIVLSAQDDVWGNRIRSNNQRIRLPENLPLYPAGDAESDKLRLLYVAMTRAKSRLYITSYTQTDTGKAATPLSFLALGDDADGWWQAKAQELDAAATQRALETAWQPAIADQQSLKAVLQPLLDNYRLSPSALKSFLDFRYGGPQAAIEQHVMHFPSAYNASSALGTATHRVLQLAHEAFQAGQPLADKTLLSLFDEALKASGLSSEELAAVRSHGHQFLPSFVQQFASSDFASIIQTEQFLTADSPTSKIPISGAIDAIASDPDGLRVIDYKTGKPPKPDWQTSGLSDSKKVSLHFYRQQLLFYKLLVDNSRQYHGKQQVSCAELVFAEPDAETEDDAIRRLNIIDFDAAELARTEQLMAAVYQRIITADLPDTSSFSSDLKGILAFEASLLES